MDADGRNETDIFRYTDVEYTPDGHSEVYRWEDFLGIAGGHVYSAMDTIDMVSAGGEYDGDEPEYAYACEIVGCCGLRDGVALFRPVSHGGTQAIESRLGSGRLGRELYVDSGCLRDDLTDKFGFFYDIDFSGLSFKTSLILSVNGLYSEGDVIDAASDWQEDYLPCVCHRGGQGEDDRWEYEPAEDYRPFTRPADIPESIFDKLCASQGTTIEKVVNDPVTPFERSFREDIFNMPQNRPVGLAVLATLPLDAFLDASLSMIRRGEGENAGTFTVKPGTYEPIFGIYDPVGGCGGTMGTVLDRDFEIDPHDITYTMMEPLKGEWQSDRIDLYTPQDCFGFSDPFGGRIEYSEKPKIAVKAKSEPAELGRRAATAAGASARDGADSRGIKL